MNEDQLAIIGFVCLTIILGCLYFSVEISNWLEKKREQRLKAKSYLTPDQIAEKERSGWKALFKHNVLAPLTIGHIIGGLGIIIENNTLGWIGVAFILYGFYVMIKD
jgi:hypothetical protein